ncbi:hypothetical protein AAKU58_000721 [Oxalobacteraceae bacterium GrIS 1.18]
MTTISNVNSTTPGAHTSAVKPPAQPAVQPSSNQTAAPDSPRPSTISNFGATTSRTQLYNAIGKLNSVAQAAPTHSTDTAQSGSHDAISNSDAASKIGSTTQSAQVHASYSARQATSAGISVKT